MNSYNYYYYTFISTLTASLTNVKKKTFFSYVYVFRNKYLKQCICPEL